MAIIGTLFRLFRGEISSHMQREILLLSFDEIS
jgi:hypothetical protein